MYNVFDLMINVTLSVYLYYPHIGWTWTARLRTSAHHREEMNKKVSANTTIQKHLKMPEPWKLLEWLA